MVKKQQNKKSSTLVLVALMMVVFTALIAVTTSALTDTTHPTILSVSPTNNEQELSRTETITAVFSEDMDPSTINKNTFMVMQRTTPEFGAYRSLSIDGTVAYSDRTATFISNEKFSPNQEYGNVFTVEITNGAKDVAGNSLSRNYVWSFTTGGDVFNTGITTSQLDQSLDESGAGSAQQPAIGNSQSGTAFPWGWAIGGLFLVLVVATVMVFAMRPAKQKTVEKTINHKKVQAIRAKSLGEVHPVNGIEGIGPEYTKGLHAMGIKTTEQLWKADALKVSLATGAPLSSVRSWQSMAELASVKDIGPQYAELLERSGVHNISQLKSYNPDRLLKLVRQKQNSLRTNIQGNPPGYATVENWIVQAGEHEFSAPLGQA